MSTNDQQYDAQVNSLQERFPQAPTRKLTRLLQRHHGDVDQVRAHLVQREFTSHKWELLETRFGSAVTVLQQEVPSAQSMKRFRLLKIMERFSGDVDSVRKFLQKLDKRRHESNDAQSMSRRQHREELKTKYASQLAELASAGIHIHNPCILRQLEKHQGDVNKVMEKMKNRSEKKAKRADIQMKYAAEITQLEAEGIQVKNKRVLGHLLEKAQGDVNQVKQLINERTEKHQQRRGYRRKHRAGESTVTTAGEDPETSVALKKRRELSSDELDNLKRLRSAGVHGNPTRILSMFHQCNESIEMTVARSQQEREKRGRRRGERVHKRTLIAEAQKAYITLNEASDWPNDIEQVYLDGNNMMFVVNSLRRLCLNRAGKKTELALGEIAAAWNERLHIPNIDLVFDSTGQVHQIGSVVVSSAQPRYRTTDDMLIELAGRPENQERNRRTIIVTSDRALAALLQNQGCRLVKPYNWFAHCMMILTPDLIEHEGMTDVTTTPATTKTRYNFDELVRRIASIDL